MLGRLGRTHQAIGLQLGAAGGAGLQLSEWVWLWRVRGAGAGEHPWELAFLSQGRAHPSLLGGLAKPAPHHLHLPLHHLQPVRMDRATENGKICHGTGEPGCHSRVCQFQSLGHVTWGLCQFPPHEVGGAASVGPSTNRPSSTASPLPFGFVVFHSEETRN